MTAIGCNRLICDVLHVGDAEQITKSTCMHAIELDLASGEDVYKN